MPDIIAGPPGVKQATVLYQSDRGRMPVEPYLVPQKLTGTNGATGWGTLCQPGAKQALLRNKPEIASRFRFGRTRPGSFIKTIANASGFSYRVLIFAFSGSYFVPVPKRRHLFHPTAYFDERCGHPSFKLVLVRLNRLYSSGGTAAPNSTAKRNRPGLRNYGAADSRICEGVCPVCFRSHWQK